MNKSFKAQQGGFTLIELIVVIVILGILAATALPRFASLSGEARVASLNAAKGALSATSALTHGKWLVTRGATLKVEGIDVAMNAVSGYPSTAGATNAANLGLASGLNAADYQMYRTNGTNRPTIGTGEVVFVPASVANTPAAVKCYVRYTPATAANSTPVVTVGDPGRTNTERAQDCE